MAGNDREVVVPGQRLGGLDKRSGNNTVLDRDGVYSVQMGLRDQRSGYINVNPFSGKYMPRQGDKVIGMVFDVGPSNWLLEINSPYPSLLHINDAAWDVKFGETAKYLGAGDMVLAEVRSVDETYRVQVTMKNQGSRKLTSGRTVTLAPMKVPRVIGKSGSMINLIKEHTGARIFVGQNGRVWVDGEEDAVQAAIKAIGMIDRESHVEGLTDRVREFLEKECD